MRPLNLTLLCAAALWGGASALAGDAMPARQASFEARQEFTFSVPEGKKKLRAWLTMPQKDPNQTVTGFKVESPYPYRVETDSEGNTFVYLEVEQPPPRLTVVESFSIVRREQRSGVNPAKTRAISDGERKKYAHFLTANTNVV